MQKGLRKIQGQLLITLLLTQSLLGLESKAPLLPLGHPGLEFHHPANRDTSFGLFLDRLLGQLYQSLQNNTDL